VFSEFKTGSLRIANRSQNSSIKNCFVTCSHPLIFSFENTHLFDTLGAGQTFDFPINLRACILDKIEVKFLVRYEVEEDGATVELPALSRFRF